jgi:hypothetical protein
MLIKRGGLAHSPLPLSSAPPGSCAVECPCCPHPGRNITNNWMFVRPENKYVSSNSYFILCSSLCLSRYLYQLALAIDANFRLKRKEQGIQDKSLSDGLAYVVQSDTYNKFLTGVPDFNEVFPIFIASYICQSIPPQINTCDSTLHAVDHANKKGIDGLAATGIGGISCARHCFNRKLGFADLQKGKKYCLCFFHNYILQLINSYLQIQEHGLCRPLYSFS